ncbi:Dihydrodipicolinate synthase [Emiliania huxleyi CCMP1516]|uniref:Dihydrodipicolinate synthase n=2 Tax=Emiliania huxleyi TaxID=2903 RepID=A0A0D3HZ37_EMIH1|nr:Dihydrodipicolinate synthase [Emiliania huxleyi CCMP1516]EOD04272.1 Dihydrodipicolinate synthase [Emiliania huxleyi CCMP1516]|eukprot:XP_005756701.1 Dihydrodipicolinate synthase [Emiliania huxleyi CCMP1516]
MLMFAHLASAAFIASRSALLPTPATHPSAAATAGTRACVATAPRRGGEAVMAGMPLPAGSLVALATPMTSTGEVDIATLRELLRWHKAEGTDGVVILGTTGEASTLTSAEKEEVMAATREEVGGEMAILVGTGTISTEATIAATKQAKLFGADAALVVTPYYVKPSQAWLVA